MAPTVASRGTQMGPQRRVGIIGIPRTWHQQWPPGAPRWGPRGELESSGYLAHGTNSGLQGRPDGAPEESWNHRDTSHMAPTVASRGAQMGPQRRVGIIGIPRT